MEPTPTESSASTESAEYPKPLVKVSRGGPNGFDVQLLVAGSSDEENAATEAGYTAVEVPALEDDPSFQKYPQWVFHQDGRRKIVYSQEELEKLEGYETSPIDPEGLEKVDVPPPPLADTVGVDPRNMAPRPVDRG